MAPLLEVRGVTKSFPGVLALDEVSFSLAAGEVVALIGENGAGKSTLMKVLAGVHRPDRGVVLMERREVAFASPGEALRAGIALIYQELDLCDNLTVTGVLFLGRELRRGPFLSTGAMRDAARVLMGRVGLDIDPDCPVADLASGQRQLLLIARALGCDARVLIMDEPTSSLTTQEANRLFEVVRELQEQGVGIVYISHRLAECEALACRVVGLRDGRNAGELPKEEVTHDTMVSLMVGRTLRGERRQAHAPGEVVMQVERLRTTAWPDAEVSFAVREREVVGIAGLLGAGRSEILRALVGADTDAGGDVTLAGHALPDRNPQIAAQHGLALVPEDRKEHGVLLSMNVRENLSLPTLRRRGYFVDGTYERELARRTIDELSIVTPGSEQVTATLSGGNQQKIVIGKWLAATPRVLLLDEPTRGIDVAARAEIYARLDVLAASGLAIVFVSSDLEEVLLLADRVLVVHEGRVAGELAGARVDEESVMSLATGKDVAVAGGNS